MLVQADDGFLYKNPILGGRGWYLWFPEMEDLASLAIVGKNKEQLRQEANICLYNWGNLITKNVYKDERIFPPKWNKIQQCYIFQVVIIQPIPHKEIINFESQISPNLMNIGDKLETGMLIWNWNYTAEEVFKIYNGEIKCFLFDGWSKNKIQRKIRDQLKIKTGKNILTDYYKEKITLHEN